MSNWEKERAWEFRREELVIRARMLVGGFEVYNRYLGIEIEGAWKPAQTLIYKPRSKSMESLVFLLPEARKQLLLVDGNSFTSY